MKGMITILIMFIFICVLAFRNNAMAVCPLEVFMQEFITTNNEWVCVKKLDKSDIVSEKKISQEAVVFPVERIKIKNGVVWVRTYHAVDYFPAKLTVNENKLILSGLMFLIPLGEFDSPEKPAFKVKKYNFEDVEFTLAPFGQECTIGDNVVLNIENIHTSLGIHAEAFLFSRKK